MKVRYEGPANPVDFSQAVDQPAGTAKYVFVPGGEYTLTKAESDKILNPVNHNVTHRFTVVAGDEPPPVKIPTSVKEI